MRLGRDNKGAVALMVGVMSPALLGFLALTVDAGFWIVGQTRLQVAADAGAMGASFLLTSASFKALSPANQQTTANTVALAEAQGAMTKLMGTLATPATVTVASDFSTVTVTLYSQASNYLGGVFNIAAPRMRATATASLKPAGACVLALGTSGNAINANNNGAITGASCGIASKAGITIDSGSLVATSITAAGAATRSSSGSNKYNPDPPTQNSGNVPSDPYATKTAPAPGTCVTHPDYSQSGGPYTANPGTWCGNQTIGGNGSTITFNPGIYIISNGDLKFNNASITSAAGVTFVLAGSSPGDFSWTNYSNTTALTAPTSGATAGIAIWQTCKSGQTTTFDGGGTLNISGTVYAPCSDANLSNNAQIKAALNGSMSVVAKTITVVGGALLGAAGGSANAGGANAVLTQ